MWDDAARARFVDTVAGHLLGGVKGEVLERAIAYWKNVDADCGAKIEEKVRAGQGGENPGGDPQDAKDEVTPIVEPPSQASQ